MLIELEIIGDPISKKRPRFYRRGNHVGVYNSQRTEEGKMLALLHDDIKNIDQITGPIEIKELKFYFKRPKSHYGTGKNADKLKTSAPVYHTKKPDIDNLKKFVLDVLNGQVWNDDAQIVRTLLTEKIWVNDNPRTIIKFKELK